MASNLADAEPGDTTGWTGRTASRGTVHELPGMLTCIIGIPEGCCAYRGAGVCLDVERVGVRRQPIGVTCYAVINPGEAAPISIRVLVTREGEELSKLVDHVSRAAGLADASDGWRQRGRAVFFPWRAELRRRVRPRVLRLCAGTGRMRWRAPLRPTACLTAIDVSGVHPCRQWVRKSSSPDLRGHGAGPSNHRPESGSSCAAWLSKWRTTMIRRPVECEDHHLRLGSH